MRAYKGRQNLGGLTVLLHRPVISVVVGRVVGVLLPATGALC